MGRTLGRMARDTTTGSNFESIVVACLQRACAKHAMTLRSQQVVGIKPGGGRHRVDHVLVSDADESKRLLVSSKTQTVSGTAEEKIAYEVIKLLHAMKSDPRYLHAYLVLGGTGFSANMLSFVRGELANYVPEMRGRVTILTTDELISTDIDVALW